MNMFANVTQDTEIKDGERDVLGGAFSVPDSGIYKATVKVAYGIIAASGAKGINVIFTLEDGTEHREVLYVTSGTAKGGNNFYINSKGEKKYLPGYTMAESLCQLITGKALAKQDVQQKTVNVYNPDAKKDVPTQVPVLMELLNKPIILGLIKKLENKRVKNQAGEYVDSHETRELAEVDKLFSTNGLTVTEAQAGQTEIGFIEKWKEKWAGQVKDVRTIKDGQAPFTPNTGSGFVPTPAPAQAAQQPAQTSAVSNLFS